LKQQVSHKNGVAGTGDDPNIEFEELDLDDIPPSDRRDGKWLLCFDFNAIARAEKITGLNLLQGISGFLANTATASEYIGLLYAGLLKAHPRVTPEKVGELVRLDLLQDIRIALIRAFNRSLPEKKRMTFEIVPEDEPKSSPTENSGNSAGQQPESTSVSQTSSSTA
jgi:hypothetical protein